MGEMITSHRARALDPRNLIVAASIFAAIGIVLGYMEFHDRADRELALRQGPPAPVALQDFNSGLHTAPAGEVSIHAEADLSKSVVLTLPGRKPSQRALVVPLYSLSEMGAAVVEAGSDASTSALTAQVARRAVEVTEQPLALGILFFPIPADAAAPEDPSVLASDVYGEGQFGLVATLRGQHADPGDFALMAAGAFSAMGVAVAGEALVVRPFAEGRRAALTGASKGQSYLLPFGAALALAIGAFVVSSGRYLRRSNAAVDGSHRDEALDVRSAHPKFAPIPTQQEIIEAAQVRHSAKPHWAAVAGIGMLRASWFALSLVAALIGLAFRAIRNRRRPQEDEAL